MMMWKLYKHPPEAYQRTYQIYFEDKTGKKWFFGTSFYYGEAASMVELLADSEVRAAVSEYIIEESLIPDGKLDFGPYHKVFKAIKPALDRICSKHGIDWPGSNVLPYTLKKALALEQCAE